MRKNPHNPKEDIKVEGKTLNKNKTKQSQNRLEQ